MAREINAKVLSDEGREVTNLDRRLDLSALLARLSGSERAVVGAFLDGLTVRETARRLGLSAPHVTWLLGAAQRELARLTGSALRSPVEFEENKSTVKERIRWGRKGN